MVNMKKILYLLLVSKWLFSLFNIPRANIQALLTSGNLINAGDIPLLLIHNSCSQFEHNPRDRRDYIPWQRATWGFRLQRLTKGIHCYKCYLPKAGSIQYFIFFC